MKSRSFLIIVYLFCSNVLFGYCATITVDINNINTPQGNWSVLVQGSWNDWVTGTELYEIDQSGTYQGSICGLSSGSYGYVHTITGEFDSWSGWGMVSNAPYNSSCDFFPNDEWHNYGFTIDSSDIFTSQNSWGECGVAGSIDDTSELLVFPPHGDELNFIHIPFEWVQFPESIGYNLQISESESFDNLIFETSTNHTLFIENTSLNWNRSYFWRVQPVFMNDQLGEWTEPNSFSTGESQFDLSSEIFSYEDFLFDYTVFGDWNNFRTSILDINGKEIWNSGNYPFMMSHVSDFGQLFGFSSDNYPNSTGIEIDYNKNLVWNSMQELDQHEFKQISNGNYMGFSSSYRHGPIPFGEWTSSFQALGYQADAETHEFPYLAQKLIELDSNTKEIVWSWDPHDHYSKLDVDLYGNTWWESFGGTYYDWTHSNAFFYDANELAVYISSRHLSRITKIDYTSGDIIWIMGLPSQFMHSGDQHICTDLEFSFQHHIQRLDNGNLLFFDNGNLDYIFGNEMTSRAIEVEVIDNSYCNIVWEYVLPPELAAYGMGSVQALDNGNYLINTTGGGGTVLEVDVDGNILWSINLGLSWPNGSGYRAYRIPSIHPALFSIKADNFINVNINDSSYRAIETSLENNKILISVSNHSGFNQPYIYTFTDNYGYFEESSGIFNISAYDSHILEFEPNNLDFELTEVHLSIVPKYHPNNEKTINYNIYNNSVIMGDVDLNGSVNVLDIILAVTFIIDDIEPSTAQFNLIDLNQDNQINVLDIIDLINIILR
ncbi:aryl-sulfate sulfotransferase [Candidatus Marinimicrobia bacterium]|nr:aryl-sulfate sulfotransferase [Candidatus Neomarinimicrobiota bacterium]